MDAVGSASGYPALVRTVAPLATPHYGWGNVVGICSISIRVSAETPFWVGRAIGRRGSVHELVISRRAQQMTHLHSCPHWVGVQRALAGARQDVECQPWCSDRTRGTRRVRPLGEQRCNMNQASRNCKRNLCWVASISSRWMNR